MGGGGWISGKEWVSGSRGRSWVFRLDADEIVGALSKIAAKRDDTFTLLSCVRTERDGKWFSTYTEMPLDALTLEGPWQYFVRSRNLAPVIPANEPLSGVGWPSLFALNGMLLLHHPDPVGPRNGPSQSSIGLMHRVGNTTTGEVVEHAEADQIFHALKRALRAAGAEPV
jgi:hypothetical protein